MIDQQLQKSPLRKDGKREMRGLTIASILIARPPHIRHAIIAWLSTFREILLCQTAKIGTSRLLILFHGHSIGQIIVSIVSS
jgi:hypothetical protein